MVRLAKGLVRHQPLGIRNGGRIIAALLQLAGQPTQHLRQPMAVLLPLGLHPVVIESRQQVVLIEPRGLFERPSFHRPIECLHIDEALRIAPPQHRMLAALQQAASGRQSAAKMVQQLAKVGARLRLAGFGPQSIRQLVSGCGESLCSTRYARRLRSRFVCTATGAPSQAICRLPNNSMRIPMNPQRSYHPRSRFPFAPSPARGLTLQSHLQSSA